MTRGYSICKRCERFFKQNDTVFCNKCQGIMNKNGQMIRAYLEQNAGSSVMDLSLNLGISIKNVNLFLENQGSFLTIREDEVLEGEELKAEEESATLRSSKVLMSRRRR